MEPEEVGRAGVLQGPLHIWVRSHSDVAPLSALEKSPGSELNFPRKLHDYGLIFCRAFFHETG
jgi:hypothetical protein